MQISKTAKLPLISVLLFISAISQPHGQLWIIIERTASLAQNGNNCAFINLWLEDHREPRNESLLGSSLPPCSPMYCFEKTLLCTFWFTYSSLSLFCKHVQKEAFRYFICWEIQAVVPKKQTKKASLGEEIFVRTKLR